MRLSAAHLLPLREAQLGLLPALLGPLALAARLVALSRASAGFDRGSLSQAAHRLGHAPARDLDAHATLRYPSRPVSRLDEP